MNVTVIGMIYKSISYLDFMVDQFKRYCVSDKHNVEHLIVANNANERVLNNLKINTIPYLEYYDKKPDDYYLNRVYRAWNYGAANCPTDFLIFVNSDMAYSPGWLDALLPEFDRNTIPCSRLVESGKMPSGEYGISMNFGQRVQDYNEKAFLNYAEIVKTRDIAVGGLYMPCLFSRKDFIESGGYPEGNVYEGGIGNVNTPFIKSGDAFFFQDTLRNKTHITVLDSIVYHIQEGELDEFEI